MTRHEQLYYNNIERIATALEKLVAQGKEDNISRFKKASILYGNDATVKPDKGRSDDNYTYPQFVNKHYTKESSHGLLGGNLQDVHMKDSIRPTTGISKSSTGRSALDSFVPDIQSELDERMYKESQSITGGEFSNWHSKLTAEERKSYQRIYGH
jgi:hypothetical protein